MLPFDLCRAVIALGRNDGIEDVVEAYDSTLSRLLLDVERLWPDGGISTNGTSIVSNFGVGGMTGVLNKNRIFADNEDGIVISGVLNEVNS